MNENELAIINEVTGRVQSINVLTSNILMNWDSERIEKFASHLLGDKIQEALQNVRNANTSNNSGYTKCPECDSKGTLTPTWHCSNCYHSFEKRHFA